MSNKNQQAEKVVKGGKSDAIAQKNTITNLLNRSIKFRKSRYVDQKFELFKKKFAPVNGVSGVVHATSAYDNISAGGGAENVADKVDANGFTRPSKVLFAKDKLNSGWNDIHPVGSGLKDLGQLSSLNAVLQVLTYTPALANYMMNRTHSANCTIQDYCFVCAVEEHIRTALKGSPYALQPRVFVGKLKKMPHGSSNKDAFDVWNYFMEQMQSFLLSEKRSKDKLVQETTALYQIFGGYIQKKLECPSCNKFDNVYDSFLDLSLDLTQCSTVERCLTKHFKQQITASRECTSCQHEGEQKGTHSIYKSPMTLTLQLKRFNADADTTKINKFVKFEESMDIKRVITANETVNTKYNLYAAIVHTGQTINDGHYMAYVKSSNGIWYCMDNENVQVVSVKRLLEEKPYMLFYNTPPPVAAKRPKASVDKAKSQQQQQEITVEAEIEDAPEEEQAEEEEIDEDVIMPQVDNREEEKELEAQRLKQAMEEVSTKEKVENTAAIVVDHNANMKTKREKLGALIEKESAQSKSAEVKGALLAKTPNNQFQDDISTWEDDVVAGAPNADKRNQVLKQIKPKRKRVDMYDLDYDRGKVKKVKNKQQDDKFSKPNMFQITADMKQSKKSKKHHK
ncbi:hypothetical protein V8B55DRAFT_1360061 [Mucor lusitanicus]|uniref:ubiquitinyl hydrolase 1 n=1 Tax=Mucor lusitanicus CBS 277.49 TaxID=747725 RepID=A0A162ZW34_MUCCL|nr:hypothetical protein MUCCIDRAFT_105118 [Mucor lusitanicus CBS 277.49]